MPNTNTVSYVCTEGHANALALNKDSTQIAIAGRNVLKVFSIEKDGFTEVCNMRGGKNQNLSYSSNDVAWSSLDVNILATAATNGVVCVWDLSKFGRHKQSLVYNEHERTAHTVDFHATEYNLLISGSQDGTIKTYDLRHDKSTNTYFSNSEAVRDVKFSPHASNIFSAVSENGTVQLWDLRNREKCFVQFSAHSAPIYTCNWHPTKNWLATGCREGKIKIWNMESKPVMEHLIRTSSGINHMKWRPEYPYQLATCGLLMDYAIHVFDIRRPYIPFVSFKDHTNTTTDIAWKGDNSQVLLSTSKDCTVMKHDFKDAKHVLYNLQGARLGRNGNITFANELTEHPTAAQVVKSNSFVSRNKSLINAEDFYKVKSSICKFLLKPTNTGYKEDNTAYELEEHSSFIGCAKELMLTGKLIDICDHNAKVSKKYGKCNAITLWNLVKFFYGSPDFMQTYEHRNSFSNQKNVQNIRRPVQQNAQSSDIKDHPNSNTNSNNGDVNNLDGSNGSHQSSLPENYVIVSDSKILSDITFDNFELLMNGCIYVGQTEIATALNYPNKPLHEDLDAARPQWDRLVKDRENSPPNTEVPILKVTNIPPVHMWEPHKFMADSILLQNDMGDVQTALTILIVMGDARKLLPINDAFISHLFQVYINQLHKYQLWYEACRIINLSWLPSVSAMNQQSTGVHTNCGDCGRPLGGSAGWFCQKCKSVKSFKCCICNLVVRGLFAWCQGCSHGGHIDHLKNYFQSRSKCPKCGHLCEYN